MKKFYLISLSVIMIITILVVVVGYNNINSQDEAVSQAFGDLNATLQRRSDLIPNLVATVKAYTEHESSTLLAITKARAEAGSMHITSQDLTDPHSLQAFADKQMKLQNSLSRLLIVVEKYPVLKASDNFKDLQHQLEGTENRINVARQEFNSKVRAFNTSLRVFPTSIINSLFIKLERKAFFTSTTTNETPKVTFN